MSRSAYKYFVLVVENEVPVIKGLKEYFNLSNENSSTTKAEQLKKSGIQFISLNNLEIFVIKGDE